MKLLDNLVEKLDNDTKEIKRLANETNRRVEELKTAVIQVDDSMLCVFDRLCIFLVLDIGFIG